MAFQFDLYLPEGITILSAEADRSRVPENTSLSMSQQEDGSYRFITAAMSGETLVGKSGSIVNLTVKADENISAGKKTGYFRKIKFAKADATGKRYSEMSFGIDVKEQPCTVTAKSYTRVYGDANPVFEYTTEGASLNGTPTITCNATETSVPKGRNMSTREPNFMNPNCCPCLAVSPSLSGATMRRAINPAI